MRSLTMALALLVVIPCVAHADGKKVTLQVNAQKSVSACAPTLDWWVASGEKLQLFNFRGKLMYEFPFAGDVAKGSFRGMDQLGSSEFTVEFDRSTGKIKETSVNCTWDGSL